MVGAISYESSGTFNYQVMLFSFMKRYCILMPCVHVQTLINKLSVYVYTHAMIYSLVSFNLYFCRFFTGPLPGILCNIQALQVFVKDFLFSMFDATATITLYRDGAQCLL